jgi:predicted CXXCH cytochrome family protein
VNGVACTACHSIHKSTTPKFLLSKSQPELCYGCHSNVRGEFSMPFKHRVNEGFMKCTDCHNPHGTFPPTWRMAGAPSMVKQSLANEEACLNCHFDKRGPFAFDPSGSRAARCAIIRTVPRTRGFCGDPWYSRFVSSATMAPVRSAGLEAACRSSQIPIICPIHDIRTARIATSVFMGQTQTRCFSGRATCVPDT